ncbi:uncharacterized protein BDZ99DRAFT_534054 [Mytilinidion resinicola]|uniref:SnoaL-like domain-containing protein n=1 Tax=Mytilinidion resinicola TaxID=574789 RepID=A0A6A6YH52_9PEZI|nr:uncharacterized protein BDZ99DRAFT_534054 [Mytilinidion resinicola]KAF2808131.1 hypothetical protein BDZ99DRAFT_534054 [Mytilinidion resinicola]
MAELATTNTEWPSIGVAPSTKQLLDDFFVILDEDTPDAGEKLATRIFTPDGTFITSSEKFTGFDEIKVSREHAYDVVKERVHTLIKVYTSTDDGSDLLAIGDASIVLHKNDIKIAGNLIARIVLKDVGTDNVRIKYFQVWGDSGPMIKALQAAA